MLDLEIGIQAYKKSKELDNKRSSSFSETNFPEISFQNALKAAEESLNSGVVNQPVIANLSATKITSGIIENVRQALDKTTDSVNGTISQNTSTAETVAIAMHAETLIKSVVSIRDKLVSSYQEILRMNI